MNTLSIDPQLKLFDDSPYTLPQKSSMRRVVEEKISDITKATDMQLRMDFSWEQLSESIDTSNSSLDMHLPELSVHEHMSHSVESETQRTLMHQILGTLDYDDHFVSMTKEMTQYGFSKLWLFNRFFKKFLFSAYQKLPSEILVRWIDQTLSYEESRQVVEVLKQAFVDCNTSIDLQYPFRGTRFEHMRRIYINQFYSLFMPQEKSYYANRKAWGILFDKKKYRKALPFYQRVLAIHPDDWTIQKRVNYITEVVK